VAHLGSDMASQAAFGPQSAATYFRQLQEASATT
jgi:hypothetical protein